MTLTKTRFLYPFAIIPLQGNTKTYRNNIHNEYFDDTFDLIKRYNEIVLKDNSFLFKLTIYNFRRSVFAHRVLIPTINRATYTNAYRLTCSKIR